MPQTTGRTSSPVASKVVVSRPLEEGSRPSSERTLASRRRSKTESSVLQESGRSSSAVEWVDVVEEDPARRRRTTRRRAGASSSGGGHKARSGNTEGDIGKFFGTRLGRILESVESGTSTRTPSRTSGSGKASQGSSTRRHRHREETGAKDRRPTKHRVGSLSKRPEPLLRVSPSLLSVLSGLTGVSDSSSNTTITQRSYYNRENPSPEAGGDHSEPKTAPTVDNNDDSQLNVFDYMETSEDEEDARSVASSSSTKSSHDQRSDAGSSEHPGTPSSLSSCPSPTTTRNGSSAGSVSELRRKYDSQFSASAESPGPGPKSSGASMDKSRRIGYQIHEDGSADASNQSAAGSDGRSSSLLRSSRHEDKLRQQREAMQYHQSISQSQQYAQHPTLPDYDQYRSYSGSSTGSAGSSVPYPPFTAMQHYHHPSAPIPYPHPEQPGHVATPDRPPAPDAPDLSKRTLTGYELLALELSTPTSPIQPLYRKFCYLNHRILLHLQDELSEMESQLRTFDEIIAQMEPPTPVDQPRQPASRRAESVGGTEVHHRRTALLGRIFLKTEQYSRAMTSFVAMEKESSPAGAEQVGKYRAWLEERRPIHEVESKFLEFEGDLFHIKTSRQPALKAAQAAQAEQIEISSPSPSMNAVVVSCLPLALMLPILLFSIIPTFAGRLTVTLLIAGAAFVVGTATRLRDLMERGEWVVCGGVYVLLMAGVAGCVPTRGG